MQYIALNKSHVNNNKCHVDKYIFQVGNKSIVIFCLYNNFEILIVDKWETCDFIFHYAIPSILSYKHF